MKIYLLISSIMFILILVLHFGYRNRPLTPKGFWVGVLLVIMIFATGILLALGVDKLL
ncbi:hypothetical protein LCGC14_1769040 [marine sediment metagenome]|uniref:Uncharacterized protein n=1 Tax=marine sediment metagenome TaxID=412755 RepID=A0A0F9GYS3_9ZZZZ